MPGQAAKVAITERQQVILEVFRRSRAESQSVSQRAEIVLLAFEGEWNQGIAVQVSLGRDEVGKWRCRWRNSWEQLTRWECVETLRLREAICEMLRDRVRPEPSPPSRSLGFWRSNASLRKSPIGPSRTECGEN